MQKLGFESWNAAHARGGSRQITLEDARKGIAAMKRDLWDFYSDRRREVGEQGVLAEAEAVSRLVADRGPDPRLTAAELMDTVKNAAAPDGLGQAEALKRMRHLGLVWEIPETNCWEPGIPSLCAFLVTWEGTPVG